MYLQTETAPECDTIGFKEKYWRLGEVKYWVQAIIDQLYGIEAFAEEDLDRYIQELCCCIDMRIPRRASKRMDLVVERKSQAASIDDSLLETWKQFNNQFLKSLNNTGS